MLNLSGYMSERPIERLEQFAIEVILERRYGKRAALLRFFLLLLSKIYEQIVRIRWWLYDQYIFKSYATGCLVISVGNLTVGGTGKTPVVEKIARMLVSSGRRVAILSRGYKSKKQKQLSFWQKLISKLTLSPIQDPPRIVSDGNKLFLDAETAGDEPHMLARNVPGAIVLVDKDRVKCAEYAVRQFAADTLILDDGYQYFKLKERINLLLVDREHPFGNQFLLPRGTLREPKDSLKRGDLILMTKCDGSDTILLEHQIHHLNTHAKILHLAHSPRYLQNAASDEKITLDYLQGRKIGAICGIAVPLSFKHAIEKLGAEIIYWREYADHHAFTEKEIFNALERTRIRGGHVLLMTEKDAVRLPKSYVEGESIEIPILFLRVEIEPLEGEDSFKETILEICTSRIV